MAKSSVPLEAKPSMLGPSLTYIAKGLTQSSMRSKIHLGRKQLVDKSGSRVSKAINEYSSLVEGTASGVALTKLTVQDTVRK